MDLLLQFLSHFHQNHFKKVMIHDYEGDESPLSDESVDFQVTQCFN